MSRFPVFRHFDKYFRCADDVPGIEKLHAESLTYLDPLRIIASLEKHHAVLRIFLRIEGSVAFDHGTLEALVEIFLVFLLDVAAVHQHHLCQIALWHTCKDGSLVSLLIEQRNAPDVIHVRMREHHSIDLCGFERKPRVLLRGLRAPPLEKPAIKQNTLGAHLKLVACPCHFSGRPMGDKFHRRMRPNKRVLRVPCEDSVEGRRVRERKTIGLPLTHSS